MERHVTTPPMRPLVAGGAESPPPSEEKRGAFWRLVGASEIGSGHVKTGTPCQDAHASATVGDGWLAIAVADGAGSAEYSDLGALAASGGAIQQLALSFAGSFSTAGEADRSDDSHLHEMLRRAVGAGLVAIETEADRLGVPPRQLASTLIVALLGPGRAAVAQVGDGGAVVERADGRIETLAAPDVADAEGGDELWQMDLTTFLTSPGALDSIRFAGLDEPVRSLAVLTDGLQMLALHFPDWRPHQPFFEPVFRFVRSESDSASAVEELRRMLRSDGVRSRTADDVTLVVACRAEEPTAEVSP